MTNRTKTGTGLVAVFDIDGTVLDTMPKMHNDINGAFKRLGYEVTSEQIDAQRGWYDISTRLGISKEDFDREFDKRKSWEQSLKDGEAPLFPDTIPCLEYLANEGVTLAALTMSDPKYTKAKIDYHGLNKYFGDRIAVTPVTAKNKREEASQLIGKINPSSIRGAYFIGDKGNDVAVSEDIKDIYSINTSGIYVNRSVKPVPQELTKYHNVKSLAEIPAIMGVQNGR
jgi:phosphoglycolate phosphatase-like HAD superfamily hydrolase